MSSWNHIDIAKDETVTPLVLINAQRCDTLLKIAQPEFWNNALFFYVRNIIDRAVRLVVSRKRLYSLTAFFDETSEAKLLVFNTGLLSIDTLDAIYGICVRHSVDGSRLANWYLFSFEPQTRLFDDVYMKTTYGAKAINPKFVPSRVVFYDETPSEICFNSEIPVSLIFDTKKITDDIRQIYPQAAINEIDLNSRVRNSLDLTQRLLTVSPRHACPAFDDTVRFLIPLNFELNGTRVVVIGVIQNDSPRPCYELRGIISVEKAYLQARLIQPVDHPWLITPHVVPKIIAPPKDVNVWSVISPAVKTPPLSPTIRVEAPVATDEWPSNSFDVLVSLLNNGENGVELARLALLLKKQIREFRLGKGICKRFVLEAERRKLVKIKSSGPQNYIYLH